MVRRDVFKVFAGLVAFVMGVAILGSVALLLVIKGYQLVNVSRTRKLFSQRPSFDGPTVFSGAIFDAGVGVAICGLEGKAWPARKTPAGFACYLEDRDKPLSDGQKIYLLRHEAHKQGLRWEVFCTRALVPDDPSWQFQGWAVQPGDNFGAVRAVHGATQADTAYLLYQAIQQPPNREPTHSPIKRKEVICPPTLYGE